MSHAHRIEIAIEIDAIGEGFVHDPGFHPDPDPDPDFDLERSRSCCAQGFYAFAKILPLQGR